MLTYITENEYKKLLGVESIPDNFNQLNIQASSLINYKTFGRIDINNIPEQVKYVTCLIINLEKQKDIQISEIGNVKSQSIEGWSETYSSTTEIEKDFNSKVNDILQQYLFDLIGTDGQPLLYRGFPAYE
jgi:hypothetical protein